MLVQDLSGYGGDGGDQWLQQLMMSLQGQQGMSQGPNLPQPSIGAGAGAGPPQGTPAQPQASALGTGSGAPLMGAFISSAQAGQPPNQQALALQAALNARARGQAQTQPPSITAGLPTGVGGPPGVGAYPPPNSAAADTDFSLGLGPDAAATAAGPPTKRPGYYGSTSATPPGEAGGMWGPGSQTGMPWRAPQPGEAWGGGGAVNPVAAQPTATPAGTATATPAAPNLGYYRPAVGNARQAQWMPPGVGRGAPPLPGSFPGPLAAPQPGVTAAPAAATAAPPAAPTAAAAAAPATAQIQPGQPGYIGPGTRFLRNLFGAGAGANANG